MKWFKHDSNAAVDAKLKKLRHKYGLTGYGLYWYLLECIARTIEIHNLTFELEEDADLISAEVGVGRELVEEMMLFMVDLGLFENEVGRITCLKLASRSDEYTTKLLRQSNGLRTLSGATPDKVRSIRIEQNRTEQKKTSPKLEPSRKPDPKFNQFWDRYNYKVKKANALKVWHRMTEDERQEAINRVSSKEFQTWRSAQFKPDKCVLPHPTTWLNGKQWEDELVPFGGVSQESDFARLGRLAKDRDARESDR